MLVAAAAGVPGVAVAVQWPLYALATVLILGAAAGLMIWHARRSID